VRLRNWRTSKSTRAGSRRDTDLGASLRRGHFFEAGVHFGGGAGMHAATLSTTSNSGSVVSSGAYFLLRPNLQVLGPGLYLYRSLADETIE
jgi:hypothetical protein